MNIQQVKKNKKGFTIIELVIVIAVIAILAAVLIPTFTTVVNKSHESNAVSRAKSAYTEMIASTPGASPSSFAGKTLYVNESDGKYYSFTIDANGQLPSTATASNATDFGNASAVTGMSDVKIKAQ